MSIRRCVALLVLPVLLSAACSNSGGIATSPAPESASAAPGTIACSYPSSGTAARPVKRPAGSATPTTGTVTAVLKTNAGTVRIAMDRAKAPCTVNSFASLAGQKSFDGTRCHRLTTSGILVLQCGDPSGTGSGGPGYTFADETTGHDTYPTGVVAMANAGADTNGSQFFLIYGDSSGLNSQPDYTVFGKMDAASLQVVQKIARQGEDDSNGPGDGKPLNPAQIITATLS